MKRHVRAPNALAIALTAVIAAPCAAIAQIVPPRRNNHMAIVRDYDGDTTSASYSAVVTPRVHLITAYDFGEPATAPPEATLAPVTIAPDYEDPRYTITIADGRPYTLSLITAYDPRAADSREVYLPPLSIIRDYDSGTGTSARRYNAAPLEIVIDFDESVRTTLPALIIAR